MTQLVPGLIRTDEAMDDQEWNIHGMRIQAKAEYDSAIVFTMLCEPSRFVPVHVHPERDEVILVQSGELQVKLDGRWSAMNAGDLIRIPRGLPHGFFNTSEQSAQALFIMSPAEGMRQMFDDMDDVADMQQTIIIAARYGLDILPLDANE